jgi:hypothetical protein
VRDSIPNFSSFFPLENFLFLIGAASTLAGCALAELNTHWDLKVRFLAHSWLLSFKFWEVDLFAIQSCRLSPLCCFRQQMEETVAKAKGGHQSQPCLPSPARRDCIFKESETAQTILDLRKRGLSFLNPQPPPPAPSRAVAGNKPASQYF